MVVESSDRSYREEKPYAANRLPGIRGRPVGGMMLSGRTCSGILVRKQAGLISVLPPRVACSCSHSS